MAVHNYSRWKSSNKIETRDSARGLGERVQKMFNNFESVSNFYRSRFEKLAPGSLTL